MTPASVAIVDEYWAADLGCDPRALRPVSPRVQAHAGGLDGYGGVFILTLGAAPVVSAPPALVDQLTPKADAFTAVAASDPPTLRALLQPAQVTAIIGPAWLNYADGPSLSPLQTGGARLLTGRDGAAFESMRAGCPPEEWDLKAFDLASRQTFGSFNDAGELLAVADFEIWGGKIAHLSVVTHPGARRQGHGARVVAAAARAALDAGLVLQYRVLRRNLPSVAVAEKLGFQTYGWSVAARLGVPA